MRDAMRSAPTPIIAQINCRVKNKNGEPYCSYAETHDEDRIMINPPPRRNVVGPITRAALVVIRPGERLECARDRENHPTGARASWTTVIGISPLVSSRQ